MMNHTRMLLHHFLPLHSFSHVRILHHPFTFLLHDLQMEKSHTSLANVFLLSFEFQGYVYIYLEYLDNHNKIIELRHVGEAQGNTTIPHGS